MSSAIAFHSRQQILLTMLGFGGGQSTSSDHHRLDSSLPNDNMAGETKTIPTFICLISVKLLPTFIVRHNHVTLGKSLVLRLTYLKHLSTTFTCSVPSLYTHY